jgi:hypothetical protein
MNKEKELKDLISQIKELKAQKKNVKQITNIDFRINKLEYRRYKLTMELQDEWAQLWVNRLSKRTV